MTTERAYCLVLDCDEFILALTPAQAEQVQQMVDTIDEPDSVSFEQVEPVAIPFGMLSAGLQAIGDAEKESGERLERVWALRERCHDPVMDAINDAPEPNHA